MCFFGGAINYPFSIIDSLLLLLLLRSGLLFRRRQPRSSTSKTPDTPRFLGQVETFSILEDKSSREFCTTQGEFINLSVAPFFRLLCILSERTAGWRARRDLGNF